MSGAAQPDWFAQNAPKPPQQQDWFAANTMPAQSATAAADPQWPVTPLPGESFADTMKRAVAQRKALTPAQGQQAIAASEKQGIKEVPAVLTSSLLAGPALLGLEAGPEALGTLAGGGVPGGIVSGAAGGAGSELINKGLHAAAGENVFNRKSAEDVGESAAIGAAAGLGTSLFGSVLNSKLARGMVNESVGATARDVTYGNPAKALLDEGIKSPTTGDIEAYKDALRSGLPPQQALQRAGGRVAAVAQKVNQLSPQVDALLSKSTAQIPVADVIDKPLNEAANEIIQNPAMRQEEKDAALSQLGGLQQSLKEGLQGPTISPLQANRIKQAIGDRINWGGNISVTDEVKPAYRAVYGSLKRAINDAVPGVAETNERLTNLLAAQTDLQKLMAAEEVGQGKGALGSAVTGIARRAEAVAGRGIPALAAVVPHSGAVGAAAGTFSMPFFNGASNDDYEFMRNPGKWNESRKKL